MTRLKIVSALAACGVLAMFPAAADAGQPVASFRVAEVPEASERGDGAGPMAHPGMMGSGMMENEDHRVWACTGAGGHVDGRLAYARAELHISAAQDSLWQAYATAAREAEHSLAARCKDRPQASLGLPDRLDRQVEAMAARLEALRATNRALRPLYEALDASQKKAADEIMGMGMGMMGAGRWR